MNRKDFLKGVGLAGIGTMLPFDRSHAARLLSSAQLPEGTCVLIPSETAGPFPIDLSGNAAMFRQDITEGNAGTLMALTLRVVNINDQCNPIQNARVDVWHCDVDGYYSGFNTSSWLGPRNNVGQTFFRGIQMTDLNGEVHFTTIYPGWYPGRAVHIHFQVFLNSVLSATSQLCFPENINAIVNATAPYSAHGQNPTINSSDGIFSDMNNTQYQIANVVANGTGGYDASLLVGINGPTTGIIDMEPETGGQFKLYQNYPNPFRTKTDILVSLKNHSKIKVEIFDLNARKLALVTDSEMGPGEHSIVFDFANRRDRWKAGGYVYQVTVENQNGVFRQCKILTIE